MFDRRRPFLRCRRSLLFNLLSFFEIVMKFTGSSSPSSSSSSRSGAGHRHRRGRRGSVFELEIVVVVKSAAANATGRRIIVEGLFPTLLPDGADGVDGRMDLVADRVLFIRVPRIQR